MGVEGSDAKPLLQTGEDVDGVPDLHHEAGAPGAQGCIEIGEALVKEGIVAGGHFRLAPERGFDDVERQGGTAACCRSREGSVVVNAEVSLEPDDVDHGWP